MVVVVKAMSADRSTNGGGGGISNVIRSIHEWWWCKQCHQIDPRMSSGII
jgi:hypothetical protein